MNTNNTDKKGHCVVHSMAEGVCETNQAENLTSTVKLTMAEENEPQTIETSVSLNDAPSDIENQSPADSETESAPVFRPATTVSFTTSREGEPETAEIESQKLAPSPPQEVRPSVPAPPSLSILYKATKAPKETLQAVYKAGEYKASLPLNLLVVHCFMAGIYIGMAGHLYLAVGGGIPGASLFPTGLIAVVLTSAELFTGDALVFVASVLGRKVSIWKLLRNWTVAWIMNFAGCLFWAGLMAYASGSLEDLGVTELAVAVALKKSKGPWWHIFIKGIGANFMVCIAVWQATTAEEVAGKILGIWFPVAAFIMMGFDHSIANQFLIPVGMMCGADISISHLLFQALLPATLGNIVGGGIMVGAVYWYVYDSMSKNVHIIERIRQGLRRHSSIARWESKDE